MDYGQAFAVVFMDPIYNVAYNNWPVGLIRICSVILLTNCRLTYGGLLDVLTAEHWVYKFVPVVRYNTTHMSLVVAARQTYMSCKKRSVLPEYALWCGVATCQAVSWCGSLSHRAVAGIPATITFVFSIAHRWGLCIFLEQRVCRKEKNQLCHMSWNEHPSRRAQRRRHASPIVSDTQLATTKGVCKGRSVTGQHCASHHRLSWVTVVLAVRAAVLLEEKLVQ